MSSSDVLLVTKPYLLELALPPTSASSCGQIFNTYAFGDIPDPNYYTSQLLGETYNLRKSLISLAS
jgi:hypothetical protein